jgi:hypothetical protein
LGKGQIQAQRAQGMPKLCDDCFRGLKQWCSHSTYVKTALGQYPFEQRQIATIPQELTYCVNLPL